MQEGDLFLGPGRSFLHPIRPMGAPPSGLQGARGQALVHLGEVQGSAAPPHPVFSRAKSRELLGAAPETLRPEADGTSVTLQPGVAIQELSPGRGQSMSHPGQTPLATPSPQP